MHGPLPERPDARELSETRTSDGVRFVGRSGFSITIVFGMIALFTGSIAVLLSVIGRDLGPPLIVAGLTVFFGAIALLNLVYYSELVVDREAVSIRAFPLPSASSGRYPRAAIADVAWTKTPARNGGYICSVHLMMRDGSTITVPFGSGTEEYSAYTVERLRAALAS
jgi:hypothetical protein